MWLRSWLRATGYDARLVHNITDINDKIYEAAPGASAELAARATEWYLEDTEDLGLGMPDRLPKATESIPQIVRFIEQLIESGHAYAAGGDVYFRVPSFPEYGRLSGQRPDQVEQGEEPSALKQDPRDFALWKANKPATEDTWWDSPWGRGRPGWHIECSVMAEEEFGPAFEIHGGGLDLVFPHHENEVAQSRSLGHPFAHVWAHNGMLRFTGEKMSKSSGNVTTIRDALDEWGRETLLLFFLTALWRKPIDYSEETMAQAAARLETLRNAFTLEPAEHDESRWQSFADALDDDFDTPAALALLHDWASTRQLELLRRGLAIFGLASIAEREEAPPEVVDIAERRVAARAGRDFETSDRLRDELAALGWQMRDEPGGGYTLVRVA
jgi:cysteinyl-tRNA synthetase